MFNTQRRRTSSVNIPGPIIAALGVVVLIVGIIFLVVGHNQKAAIAADPGCVAALTVDTPTALNGKKCKIYAGTVSKAYEEQKVETRRDSNGNQHRDTTIIDHILVKDDSGKTYDVDIENGSDDPVYKDALANNGAKAKIETIDDDPVYVATSAGMAGSSSHDPAFTTNLGIAIVIIGLLVAVFGVGKTVFTILRRR